MLFNAITGLWVAVGLVIGFSIGPARDLATTPIAFFHVPMAIAMEVAFFMAAWHGICWLRTRRLHHDAMSLAFAESGAICGLIATATGAVFSRTNWGAYWNWDPKQVGIVATLLTYAALFALRSAIEDEDKQRDLSAVYVIFGLVSAIFWTFIYPQISKALSLHPTSVLTQSDSTFKFALWFNVAGYVMLLVRLAQFRARLEIAGQRLKELRWA